LRETFRDTDQIRVHPIITAGGTVVNAIPETVRLESYVRGANVEAIESANKKVNRAIAASAAALGARVTIDDELA
ncbi:MAG: amidohydrolase, partial [Clostridia bacterium]|nr:amidohydrolase [Clostridia bacterium]